MEPDFLIKLQNAFKDEASEQLSFISSTLIALEKSPEEAQSRIEPLLRTFHSLKGSSRAVNLKVLEKCFQTIESLLIKCKDAKSIPVNMITSLNEAVGAFQDVVYNLGASEGNAPEAGLEKVLEDLNNLVGSQEEMTDRPPATARPERRKGDRRRTHDNFRTLGTSNSIRLPIDRLDEVVQLSEELVYAKLVAEQRLIDFSDLQSSMNQWSRRWQRLRPEIENEVQRQSQAAGATTSTIQRTGLREFMDLHDSFVSKMQEQLSALHKATSSDRITVNTLVDTLLDRGRELTMVPFAVLQDILDRIVWDISKQQDKVVQLRIVGGDVQIDRNILDELRDPLVHLIRNCVDHGIEPPEERARKGKPEAMIVISLEPVGSGKVRINVRDDGRGIDVEKIKRSALEKQLVTREALEQLTSSQIMGLVFRSSFSTRKEVSQISGRGLGLSIVKETVERLNGDIEISSRKGEETVFSIDVPVRRATMVGITAQVGGQTVVIPTAAMKSAVRTRDQDTRVIQGRWTVSFNERLLPMIRLADILQIESDASIEDSIALVVGSSEYPLALLVDSVTGEQEVAVKNLPPPLTRVRNVAGATLLKNGDLAIVINMNDVLSSSVLVGALTEETTVREKEEIKKPQSTRQRILVVEDSITSRVLLKNILETAGYEVMVASDGEDGWNKLCQEEFDLIVTDVEMPRMNGFELTEKIRKQPQYEKLPIVVVTSLASLEDRRRGVEVGASAYFVKSNFEKSNLVDMVRRLI